MHFSAVVLAAALALAAPAQAAEVRVDGADVVFEAAAGEVNSVRASAPALTGAVTVTDSQGRHADPGSGCAPAGAPSS